ncbi:MAG TPA: 3-dehydroquinate synthase [Terriglobales bacterium]|nr:3-dehydroquinate synthase [Terriglobales bacterium]
MTRVEIAVSPRPYAALIEGGLLQRCGEHLSELLNGTHSRFFIVTVAPVRRRWGSRLHDSLANAGFKATFLQMPDGEPHKKMATVEMLAEQLARLHADRDAVILAFGGGVVGDTAGLLASIYMRGVRLIHIPTTVLAQVDASLGGKTGVNLRLGKNLLGTFYQPLAVLIDPEVLSSLPERQFRAGLYECLKCSVIGNPNLFSYLEKADLKVLRGDSPSLEWVIAESVKLKAEVVACDEREAGLRRVLNFGHTIGHALEAQSKYRYFLHGEAVGWGMIAASHIADKIGHCDGETQRRISEAVLGLGSLPRVNVQTRDILRLLQADKKARNGCVHFVLPRAIGHVDIVSQVPESVVRGSLQHLRTLSKKDRP